MKIVRFLTLPEIKYQELQDVLALDLLKYYLFMGIESSLKNTLWQNYFVAIQNCVFIFIFYFLKVSHDYYLLLNISRDMSTFLSEKYLFATRGLHPKSPWKPTTLVGYPTSLMGPGQGYYIGRWHTKAVYINVLHSSCLLLLFFKLFVIFLPLFSVTKKSPQEFHDWKRKKWKFHLRTSILIPGEKQIISQIAMQSRLQLSIKK